VLAAFAYRALLPVGAGGWGGRLDAWFFEPNRLDAVAPLMVSGWLLLRRRERLRAGEPALPAAGLAAGLAAALLAWSTRIGAPEPAVFSLIAAGLALALAWGGTAAARAAALPLALLLFVMPLPALLYNAVVWKVQLWTTDYVVWMLTALGREVQASGDLITVDGRLFHVIESCAGIRIAELSTLAAFALADLLALRRGWASCLVAAAPGLGFLANGLRALSIALAPPAEIPAHHLGQGILTFSGACLLLVGWGLVLRRLGGAGPDVARGAASARRRGRRALGLPAAVAGAAAVLAGISLAVPGLGRPAPWSPGVANALAAPTPEWEREEMPPLLVFLGATRFGDAVHLFYHHRGVEEPIGIEVFAGVGARDGRRGSPFGPKTLLPGPGWVVDLEVRGAPVVEGAASRSAIVRRGSDRMLVHCYRSGERSLWMESLLDLTGLDALDPAHRAVVRLGTPIVEEDEDALQRAALRLESLLVRLRQPLSHVLLGGEPEAISATLPAARVEPDPQVARAAGDGPRRRRRSSGSRPGRIRRGRRAGSRRTRTSCA
jgi:exosortase